MGIIRLANGTGMQDFQIDWLRTFIAVVDSGSFTAASRIISRSQSAVSMQLRKLESSAGKQLINRTPRHITLTPAGMDLLAYARQMVTLHNHAQQSMHGSKVSGTVTIGVPDDYLSPYLAPILSIFTNRFTEVEVSLTCESSSFLLPKVDNGELDIALVTRHTALRGEPERGSLLFTEPLVWAGMEQYEVWKKNPVPIAIHELGSRYRTHVLDSFTNMKRRYRVVYGSPNIAGQLAVVSSGLAVAAITKCSVPSSMKILDTRHGLPQLPELEVALVKSKDSERSSSVQALYNTIVELLRSAVQ